MRAATAHGFGLTEDPVRIRQELEARTCYSVGSPPPTRLGKATQFDAISGAPLNPLGRTGLAGRGLLGKWGPNHAADPIVTRWEPLTGHLQTQVMQFRLSLPSVPLIPP